jgi:glyoxylase-like metal-dependent hydrolase (beta-lactamase superfamily II)
MHELDDAKNSYMYMMRYRLPESGVYLKDGDKLELAGLTFDIMATPGHTLGGVTIRCEDALFTGDTLFKGSCGRTDLPGGNMDTQLESIRRICELPGDYEVYPGHMDSSTLELERLFNYYCRVALRG